MLKHLISFEDISQYESFINGDDFVTPNVSLIRNEDIVKFNPYYEEPSSPNLVCTYNVTSTNSNTPLCYRVDNITSMIVDGVEETPATSYKFNTVGEHNVEFVLTDNTFIKNFGFYGISGMTSIKLPSTISKIETGALNNCTGLETIKIDKNNTTFDSRNNCNCIVITETDSILLGCKNSTIPQGIISLEQGAFQYCVGLTEISLPDTLTTINAASFYGCKGLTKLIIPNSVTTIGGTAFAECSNLTGEFVIPEGVTELGISVLRDCKKLTSIVLPDSITTIDDKAFYGCENITSINLGPNVSSMGDEVFAKCTKLSSIRISALTEPTIQRGTFHDISQNGTLYYPSNAIYATWLSNAIYYLGYYGWTGSQF